MYKISVVIPTLNRPNDLLKVIYSIMAQSRIPDELIIVDQSLVTESKDKIIDIINIHNKITLKYIHDANVKSLTEAKQASLKYCNGNLVCFLEDDVYLNSHYLREIEAGFNQNINMIGCCGIVTNHPVSTRIYKFIFHLFHIGIFKDLRINYFHNNINFDNSLIKSNCIAGGVSAWKFDIFKYVTFDVKNKFHMLEDIEFSTRVAFFYPDSLFINSNAKLQHFSSPIGRDNLLVQKRRKTRECITFFKKRIHWKYSHISIVWLLIGNYFESILQSLQFFSLDPIRGFILGIKDGVSQKIIGE